MKKILCVILAAISIFSLILPVFAADGEQGANINTAFDISKSTISDDFVKVFGGKLKVDDYPYNPLDIQEDNIYLITCVENNVHSKSKSEMYFYIYNPTKKKLNLSSEKNQVKGWYSRLEDEKSYDDYQLKYVCSEADGVLMKFKVNGFFTSGVYNQEERHYHISGIELVNEGETTAKEYSVAQNYIFRDNENGFVMQSCEDIDTVETEVKHTYIRYYDPDNIFQAIDLQSVYFNISNEIIDKYGYIDKITAEWEECDMYPILVTDNEELKNVFEEIVFNSNPNSFEPSFGYKYGSILTSSMAWPYFDYGYAAGKSSSDSLYIFSGILPAHVNNLIPFLGGAFYVEDSWSEPQEVVVSSEELIASMNKYGWDDINFEYVDKSNYGENKKNFSVFNTSVSNSFLVPQIALSLSSNAFFRGMLDENYLQHPELFSPLNVVDMADLDLSDEEFSVKYLVNVDDVADIKAMVNENETTYILNYTITDYEVYDDVDYDDVDIEDIDESKSLIADMTAIRSFDLIEGDFVKNGVHTILPFDSDPTNFIPDITTPNRSNDGIPLWLLILIICVVTLIILKIYKAYKKSSRARKFERKFLK